MWSEQLKELESIQLYIIHCDDIQVRRRRGGGERRRENRNEEDEEHESTVYMK